MNERKLNLLAALAWMAFLFYLSSLPKLPGPEGILTIQVIRKSGHALVYGILAYLDWRVLRAEPRFAAQSVRWAWLCATLYALTDELHQGFTPERHFTGMDVLIDAAGAALAMFLVQRRQRAAAQGAPAVR